MHRCKRCRRMEPIPCNVTVSVPFTNLKLYFLAARVPWVTVIGYGPEGLWRSRSW